MTTVLTIMSLPAIASTATLAAAALGADTPAKLLTVTLGSAAMALGCMGMMP